MSPRGLVHKRPAAAPAALKRSSASSSAAAKSAASVAAPLHPASSAASKQPAARRRQPAVSAPRAAVLKRPAAAAASAGLKGPHRADIDKPGSLDASAVAEAAAAASSQASLRTLLQELVVARDNVENEYQEQVRHLEQAKVLANHHQKCASDLAKELDIERKQNSQEQDEVWMKTVKRDVRACLPASKQLEGWDGVPIKLEPPEAGSRRPRARSRAD